MHVSSCLSSPLSLQGLGASPVSSHSSCMSSCMVSTTCRGMPAIQDKHQARASTWLQAKVHVHVHQPPCPWTLSKGCIHVHELLLHGLLHGARGAPHPPPWSILLHGASSSMEDLILSSPHLPLLFLSLLLVRDIATPTTSSMVKLEHHTGAPSSS